MLLTTPRAGRVAFIYFVKMVEVLLIEIKSYKLEEVVILKERVGQPFGWSVGFLNRYTYASKIKP